MNSKDQFLFLLLITLLGCVVAGFGLIHFIGWLSARTQPATITVLPRPSVPSSPLPKSDWQVREVLSGDRLRMVHQNREITVKLACIKVKLGSSSTRYAETRLRGFTMNGDRSFRVTELGREADGSVLAELWVTQRGYPSQLAQAVLAGGGYVTVVPGASAVCPNAPIMIEAQRYAEQRHKRPRIIHF